MIKIALFTSIITTAFSTCSLQCPDKLVKSVDERCYYKIEDLTNLAQGNCNGLTQTGIGGYLPKGLHTLQLNAKGQSCDMNINVVDTTAPLIKTIRGEPNLFITNNAWKHVDFHFNKVENCCGVICNITKVEYEDIPSKCVEEECHSCDGKITKLKVMNSCEINGLFKVTDKNDNILFQKPDSTSGEEYEFSGVDSKGTMTTQITFSTECGEFGLHTSCSKPVYPGMTLNDNKLTIVSGYSRNGGLLCDNSGNQGTSSSSEKRRLQRRLRGKSGSKGKSDSKGTNDCSDDNFQSKIISDRTIEVCAIKNPGYLRKYTITGMCIDSSDLFTTKTTTIVTTNEKCTNPDPECKNGVIGDFGVCCPETCGSICGGIGCGSMPGGNENCCTGTVFNKALSCNNKAAPCVLDSYIQH